MAGYTNYTTQAFDEFSFLYVGDPQIGASKGQTSSESEKMENAGNVVTSAPEKILQQEMTAITGTTY